MSPPVSTSARLQSIIPAPVWSRSSLTRLAEIAGAVIVVTSCGEVSGVESSAVGSGESGAAAASGSGCAAG